jgi:hypothetical protein
MKKEITENTEDETRKGGSCTFRADMDVDEMLEKAVDGTGLSKSEICNAALSRHGWQIIEELMEQKQAAQKKLRKTQGQIIRRARELSDLAAEGASAAKALSKSKPH